MQPKKQDLQINPLVYLDIAIEGELAGRVICELRKDVVPKTAENFRALCTGERGVGASGKPLYFKGCKFHKAIVQFMVQSGDIISNDGSGGESIYGPTFPDENFILQGRCAELMHKQNFGSNPSCVCGGVETMSHITDDCPLFAIQGGVAKHEEGVLSMANEGRPHTNGSQFCITTVPCPHLDGSNVVFGRVLTGLGILQEIQRYSLDEDCRPCVDCVIVDCGQLRELNERNTSCIDGTPDRLPEYPVDYRRNDITPPQLISSLSIMKQCGNDYFEIGRHRAATRKYLKCLRYLDFFRGAISSIENTTERDQYTEVTMTYRLQCNLNLAACYLKLKDYPTCIRFCDHVLYQDARNEKAFYRRGQANYALANYDNALEDLRQANEASPNNKAVHKLIEEVKLTYKTYYGIQKQRLSKFFRDHEQEAPAKSARN